MKIDYLIYVLGMVTIVLAACIGLCVGLALVIHGWPRGILSYVELGDDDK
jgi:hypothetical protein